MYIDYPFFDKKTFQNFPKPSQTMQNNPSRLIVPNAVYKNPIRNHQIIQRCANSQSRQLPLVLPSFLSQTQHQMLNAPIKQRCHFNLKKTNLRQNLHFKKVKKMSSQKLGNSNFTQNFQNNLKFVKLQKHQNDRLFSINEKEELNFENRLVNSFTQTLGYSEVHPTPEYFTRIPYTCHSQIPLSKPAFRPIPIDSQRNLTNRLYAAPPMQTLIGKRHSATFGEQQPMECSELYKWEMNTNFTKNERKEYLTSLDSSARGPSANSPIRHNILSDLTSESGTNCDIEFSTISPSKTKHNHFSQKNREKNSLDRIQKQLKNKTFENVLSPVKVMKLENILQNSFLKDLDSTHQKCSLANAVKDVLSPFYKNGQIEVTKDNILVLLNLQIPFEKENFDRLDFKYKLRVITMLYVKYVNKRAFSNVCKSFMEDVDLTKDSNLNAFLKKYFIIESI